jgi:hypothetical protein
MPPLYSYFAITEPRYRPLSDSHFHATPPPHISPFAADITSQPVRCRHFTPTPFIA